MTKQTANILKFLGLAFGFVGLLISLFDLFGWFVSPTRKAFAAQVRGGTEPLLRTTPGFDEFLMAFPPPTDVDPSKITHITRDRMETHDHYPISVAVRYGMLDKRSMPVAALDDVHRWAEETPYAISSWFVTAAGWLAVACAELAELLSRRRRQARR